MIKHRLMNLCLVVGSVLDIGATSIPYKRTILKSSNYDPDFDSVCVEDVIKDDWNTIEADWENVGKEWSNSK